MKFLVLVDGGGVPRWKRDCVDLLSEAGLPLFTNVHNCARAMRVMADYRGKRDAFLKG